VVAKGLLDSGELLLRRPAAELTRKGAGICWQLCANARAAPSCLEHTTRPTRALRHRLEMRRASRINRDVESHRDKSALRCGRDYSSVRFNAPEQ